MDWTKPRLRCPLERGRGSCDGTCTSRVGSNEIPVLRNFIVRGEKKVLLLGSQGTHIRSIQL